MEMCVRIIVESVLNFKKYTSPAYLARSSSDTGDELLRAMLTYTATPFHLATVAFKSKLLLIKAPSRECGMWQMFVAANILHARVTSIFPDKGTVDVRNVCKHTVLPEMNSVSPVSSCGHPSVSTWWMTTGLEHTLCHSPLLTKMSWWWLKVTTVKTSSTLLSAKTTLATSTWHSLQNRMMREMMNQTLHHVPLAVPGSIRVHFVLTLLIVVIV